MKIPQPLDESDLSDRLVRVQRLVDDCINRSIAGEAVSHEAVVAANADLMPELGEELGNLVVIERARRRFAGSSDIQDLSENRSAEPSPTPRPGPPDFFPGYEILNEIHRGGQGVVYRAIQESTKREVAIKVLREGAFAGPRELARFEREVQILASLRHPNIVAVHESGSAAAGNFYFVMDHIAGRTLDRYMKERRRDADGISIDETLKLFAKICDAVNAAHLRGVIHRDLKPANVLVGADGNPHVLDFGLAKIMAGRTNQADDESQASALTITGQFVGSLPWASPEQARGLADLDLRTDVYSLGLILFQMLTSEFPYEVTGNIRDVMDRIINADPVRPGVLQRDINDEVDAIILKCLRKEPERRYQTAGELAREIRCYLAGEPIEAKRDSTLYVLGKNLRRHRWAVAAGLAFVAGLSVFAVYASVQAGRYSRLAQQERKAREQALVARDEQSRERKRAEKERDKAEAINEFVTKALVSSDPNQGGAQGFLVTDAMEQAVELLDGGELEDQPEMEAALRLTISEVLNSNARSEEALLLARRALEISERLHPGDHPQVALGLYDVAVCLQSLGRSAEALPKFETALEMRQRLFEGDHPDVAASMDLVALCLNSLGRSAEALPKFEAALEMRQRLFEGDHLDVAEALNNVAICLNSLGRSVEALPKYEAALEMRQRFFRGDHPAVAEGLINVGACLQLMGRLADALPKKEAALEMRQRLFDGDHPTVSSSLNSVAYCLKSLGRSAEALSKYEASLEMYQRLFEGDHPDAARTLNNLAECLNSLGRSAEALPKFEAALEMFQRLFEGDHPLAAVSLNNVANCLLLLGRTEEALSKHEAVLEMRQRLFEGDHPHMAGSLSNVAGCLDSLGRSAEALPRHEAALEMYQRLYEGDHPAVARSLYNLANSLITLGRTAEALPKYEAALEMHRRVLPPGHPYTLYPQIGIAKTLMSLGRHVEAESLLLDAVEQCNRSEASRRMHWRSALDWLTQLYDAWHTAEPDKGYDQKATEWREKLDALQNSDLP